MCVQLDTMAMHGFHCAACLRRITLMYNESSSVAYGTCYVVRGVYIYIYVLPYQLLQTIPYSVSIRGVIAKTSHVHPK